MGFQRGHIPTQDGKANHLPNPFSSPVWKPEITVTACLEPVWEFVTLSGTVFISKYQFVEIQSLPKKDQL